MKKILGPFMLFLAAMIWGSSFIIMKDAVDFFTPATLLFVRFSLASIFLSIIFKKQLKNYPRHKILQPLLTGICLFLAYYIQTKGLALTTPSKNAFLTAVYCAMVPFLYWIFYKEKPNTYHFIAAFMSIIGIGFVSLEKNLSINVGDLLTLVAGLLYAMHILLVKKYSLNTSGEAFTTIQFYSATICAFFFSLLFEDITIIKNIEPYNFIRILYLSLFATALCMLFQTLGQQRVSECRASLILSLESVFGVIFSVIFYKEVLTLKMIIGFILIFSAIVISETKLEFIKKLIKLSIVVCMIAVSLTCINVKAAGGISIAGDYGYAINATTGQVLLDKNGDTKVYPASTTKVMTALVAIENIKDLTATVTVEKSDLDGLYEAGASTANLEVGEEVSYKDLLYGIILPSGADACRVMARALFGDETSMVEAMNKKASELGLENTHFENTTGLHDDNHYTTAKDMTEITQAALKYDVFKEVFTTRSYTTETTQKYMAATILKFYWHTKTSIAHIEGCKTGYTSQAKSCLTALLTNNYNQEIICTFMNEANSASYVSDAKIVMNYCNEHLVEVPLYKKDDELEVIEIKNGTKDTYTITVPETINLYLDENIEEDDYSLVYDGSSEIEAPINEGDTLGKVYLKYKDETIKEYTITIDETIELTDFAKVVKFLTSTFMKTILGIIVFLIALAYFVRWRIRVKRRKMRRKQRRRY
jgi:D-alanyl-D-alanine carboxypeptidase/drug/metabolite transporter (DMT)-like permease